MTVLHPAAPGTWLRILFMSFHFNKARPPDVTVTQANSYNLHCHRARQGGDPTGSTRHVRLSVTTSAFSFQIQTAHCRASLFRLPYKGMFFLTRSLRPPGTSVTTAIAQWLHVSSSKWLNARRVACCTFKCVLLSEMSYARCPVI